MGRPPGSPGASSTTGGAGSSCRSGARSTRIQVSRWARWEAARPGRDSSARAAGAIPRTGRRASERIQTGRRAHGVPDGSSANRVDDDERGEDDADDAVHREERRVEPPQVAGPHEGVLVRQEERDGGDAEPVEDADRQPEPDREQAGDGRGMRETSAEERPAHAEPRDDRMQALPTVDLLVEERVEEVEARDPERDGGAEQPGLPRQLPGDCDPGTDGREAVDRTEPEVAEP